VVLERDDEVGSLIVFPLYVSLSLSMGRLQGCLVVQEVCDKDPLCSLLFVLVMEALSRMLSAMMESG